MASFDGVPVCPGVAVTPEPALGARQEGHGRWQLR
jgi:hypothetical protein